MSSKENSFSLKFDTTWTYAEAPESTSHIELKKKYDLFIDGKFQTPASKKYFKTINPATEEVIAEVAEASEKDIDKAVKAATKALAPWQKLEGKERGNRGTFSWA